MYTHVNNTYVCAEKFSNLKILIPITYYIYTHMYVYPVHPHQHPHTHNKYNVFFFIYNLAMLVHIETNDIDGNATF